jgi:deoxycytidylate deaminase
MKLKEAIEIIWQNRKYEPKSLIEALSHLNEEVSKSLKAAMRNDKKESQKELEDAFSCMLIAMKMLNINLDNVVYRQIEKMQTDISKTMHIFSDRVEMRIENEIKGGWNIYSQEDVLDAQKMAQEFKCKVIWEGATQLSLKDMVENAKKDKN